MNVSDPPLATDWKDTAGGTIEADLISFDLAEKTVVLVDDAGEEHIVATKTLSTRSKFQLLFSPKFLQAYPDDRWASQRLQVILTLTAITGFFFLIGFWLAAARSSHEVRYSDGSSRGASSKPARSSRARRRPWLARRSPSTLPRPRP